MRTTVLQTLHNAQAPIFARLSLNEIESSVSAGIIYDNDLKRSANLFTHATKATLNIGLNVMGNHHKGDKRTRVARQFRHNPLPSPPAMPIRNPPQSYQDQPRHRPKAHNHSRDYCV